MRFLAVTAVFLAVPANQAVPVLEPVQPELFGAGGALTNAWADHDGDGDIDLFVGFNGSPNRLYRNDGGRFSEVAGAVGLADARPTRAAAWGDYDGDGDPDLLLGFTAGEGGVLRLYRNEGGRFAEVTADAGLRVDSAAVRQPVWVDFDGDGDLDLFVAFRDRANAMFENSGGFFTDVARRVGLADPRRSVGAVWFDYDADGDFDLYVGNMDGDANGLFRQDADGVFTDVAEAMNLQWGGRGPGDPANGTVRPCAADVDNDGVFDLFMANYGPNGLFLNRVDDFEDISVASGIAIDSRYDSCAFADIDNDGMLDVYVNGTVTGGVAYPDHLFRNAGATWTGMDAPILQRLDGDHGVQWADFDEDGAIDLALTAVPEDGHHSLLRNRLPPETAARGLVVVVRDAAGNAIPPGSEIRLTANASGALVGARLVDSGSGYNSQSMAPAHFGLGETQVVDLAVTIVRDGHRATAILPAIDVRQLPRRVLEVRLDEGGALRLVEADGSLQEF